MGIYSVYTERVVISIDVRAIINDASSSTSFSLAHVVSFLIRAYVFPPLTSINKCTALFVVKLQPIVRLLLPNIRSIFFFPSFYDSARLCRLNFVLFFFHFRIDIGSLIKRASFLFIVHQSIHRGNELDGGGLWRRRFECASMSSHPATVIQKYFYLPFRLLFNIANGDLWRKV